MLPKPNSSYMGAASGKSLHSIPGTFDSLDMSSPFVQRVWIALELKGIPYQYIEVDPYEKPESLLEVNPRGLVPALRHNDWGCYESTVLLEYVRSQDQTQGSLADQMAAARRLQRRHGASAIGCKVARPLSVMGRPCKFSFFHVHRHR
jgi:hypothetical protein